MFSSSRAFNSNICRRCNCSHTNLVDGMCNLELVDDSYSLKTCIRMHGGETWNELEFLENVSPVVLGKIFLVWKKIASSFPQLGKSILVLTFYNSF